MTHLLDTSRHSQIKNQRPRVVIACLIGVIGLLFSYDFFVNQPEQKYHAHQKYAELGNAPSQFSMGLNYELGRGVEIDYVKAFEWYTKSAKQGYAKAQNNLGTMYLEGRGTTQDLAKAKYWYQKGADQGQADAVQNLGRYYEKFAKDYIMAEQYFRQGVELGHTYSMLELGRMYEDGKGNVPQDYAKAMELYQRAAEQGYSVAENNIGAMYHNGFGVEKDYVKASEWYHKAAEKGDEVAQRNLGKLYFYGYGVPQDYAQSYQWYEKGAKQGDIDSIRALAYFYYAGLTRPKDDASAVSLYTQAAFAGDAYSRQTLVWYYQQDKRVTEENESPMLWYQAVQRQALEKYKAEPNNVSIMLLLADSYYFGEATPEAKAKALQLYQKAAQEDDPYGLYMLGYDGFCETCEDQQKLQTAIGYFEQSANLNHAIASRYLAYAYCVGKGVVQDTEKAIYWMKKAAEQGDSDAKEILKNQNKKHFISAILDAIRDTHFTSTPSKPIGEDQN